MESQNQKWVNLSYLAVAALLAYILFSLGNWFSVKWSVEAKVHNIELFIRIGSIVVAAICFLVLYYNDQATQFMHEVVEELSRVTWPTQKETSSATFIVIIMVLISGFVLGAFDYISTAGIQNLIEFFTKRF